MAYSISFDPQPPISMEVSDSTLVTSTVTWDAGDTPPTPNDTFTYALKSPQPTPTGTVTSRAGGFPIVLNMRRDADLTSGTVQFSTSFTAATVGKVALEGFLTSQPATKQDLTFNIGQSAFTISTDGFDKKAISVANDDTLDPTTAPDNLKSTLVLTAMSTDATPAPIADAAISLFLDTAAANQSQQVGKFFDMSTTPPTPLTFTASSMESPSIQLTTDANGKATLLVISNTNSGFLHLRVAGGANSITPLRLYIYKTPTGRSTFPVPTVTLPFGDKVDFNISKYTKEKFPVGINTSIDDQSFCVVILNDKYQIDQPGIAFPSSVEGKTMDLNTSRTGENNTLFYAVTSTNRLNNSPLYNFKVENDNTGPTPGVVQLGQLLQPMTNTVIDFNTADKGLDISIDIARDQQAIQAAGKPALAAPNTCVLSAHIRAFGAAPTFPLVDFVATYPVPVDFTKQPDNHTIDIFDDFIGLGKSGTSEKGTFELWYTYFDAPDGTPIAESARTTGEVSTRQFS